MHDFWQDVRFGFRIYRRNPWSSAAAAVSLALGVGLSSAFFSAINAVLLRPLPYNPLPYKDQGQLVRIFEENPDRGWQHLPFSSGDAIDYREQNRSFEHIAVFEEATANLTRSGDPERLSGASVTADFFSVLGVQPVLGRSFQPSDERPGAPKVVLLSHGLWGRRFGSDKSIIGKTITLDEQPITVIGVLPPDFRHPADLERRTTEFWQPLPLNPEKAGRYVNRFHLIARLKPGVSLQQAQTEMAELSALLAQEYPSTNKGKHAIVVPLYEEVVGKIRPALLILFAATGFVLLIACANVANLLLSQTMARSQEFATRMAIGGGRFRLIRQLLVEGLVLGGAASLLGLLLALWVTRLLVTLSPENFPRVSEIGIDPRVIGFCLAVALVTALVASLAPIFHLQDFDLHEVFNAAREKTGASSPRRNYLKGFLVVSEIALTLLLLVGAGLLIKSFRNLQQVNPGFDPKNLITMQITLPESRYGENPQKVAFYSQLLERVRSLPGVESASIVNYLPMTGVNVTGYYIEGQLPNDLNQPPVASYRVIDTDYFRTMRIPLKKGRNINSFDRLDSEGVVIVDEGMAQKISAGQSALNRRITFTGLDGPWLTVVGVAATVKSEGLDRETLNTAYLPFTQAPWLSMTLVARTASDPKQFIAPIRNQVWSLDPNQPVYEVKTVEEILAQTVSRQRFNMLLLSLFAGVALLLAVLGVYSLMTYSVLQQRRDIGVRLALGAQQGNILTQVLGQGLRLTLLGVALGVAAAWATTKVLSNMLFGVEARDPLTFLWLAGLLVAISLIASYLPAWRACKVDPLTALREN